MLSCSSSTALRAVARQSRQAAAQVASSPRACSALPARLASTASSSAALLPRQRSALAASASIRAFSSCSPRRSEGAAASEEGKKKAPASASADGAGKEADAHAAALKEKDAKIKDLSDTLLYARADMQNLVRRSAEEKANASDYAITKLARDLVSSLDILQIALRSVPESLRKAAASPSSASSSEDAAAKEDPRRVLAELYSGLELTERSLLDQLKSHGVVEFDPTGEKFDPDLHEALYQAPVPGKTPGTVLECQKRGYKIKNRVLRAAQVGVVQGTD
ncbi:unnamed protein product [Tilletia controversa]|nr:unnamed protein product [Tilletia controversa]